MIDKIDSVVNAIGGFLYQPYIVPLFLIVAGLYFTIRTGLIQFRLFGESIHVVAEKPKEKGSISSFGALMVSTASRVGTGNIVGVSTAICLGGFGAVFWMGTFSVLIYPVSHFLFLFIQKLFFSRCSLLRKKSPFRQNSILRHIGHNAALHQPGQLCAGNVQHLIFAFCLLQLTVGIKQNLGAKSLLR